MFYTYLRHTTFNVLQLIFLVSSVFHLKVPNLLSCIVFRVKRGTTRYPNYVENSFRVVPKNICIYSNNILNTSFRVRDPIDFVRTVYSYFTILSEMDYTSGQYYDIINSIPL